MREIVDTTILSAMGPPGGGRNLITARLLRHYFVFSTNESDDKTLTRIFGTIVDLFIKKNDIGSDPAKVLRFAPEASVEMYQQLSENLKPTPAKSHYLFNLRDLSRLFQGILMIKKEEADTAKKMALLWIHETCRVFYDRLINVPDREWFYNTLVHTTKQKLRENDFKSLFKGILADEKVANLIQSPEILKFIKFGDVMSDDIVISNRPYDIIVDPEALKLRLQGCLEDFNSQSRKPM